MLELHHEGIPPAGIAWFLHRHISTVRRWIARAAALGDLHDKERGGRPRLFPEAVRPRTLITRDRDEIKHFAQDCGRIVLKPLQGVANDGPGDACIIAPVPGSNGCA